MLWQLSNNKLEVLQLLATIAGGIFVIWNIRLTQQRLITERFSKAIEQLGDANMTIRLGGIYALEQIAKDSLQYHWTVMEVLTSFVREKVPYIRHEHEPERSSKYLEYDVQAVLTVIGRRNSSHDPSQNWLDLRRTDLRRAHFLDADLSNVLLIESNLCNANFSNADLRGAYLKRAKLFQANFRQANLSKTNLYHAELKGAKGLTLDQVQAAEYWEQAFYDEDFMGALGLSSERGENSKEK